MPSIIRWLIEILKSVDFIENFKQQNNLSKFLQEKKVLQLFEKSFMQHLSLSNITNISANAEKN